MRPKRLLQGSLLLLASLTLAGCQLAYEVSVAVQDGHLIFKTVRKGFGPDQPATVEQLRVVEASQYPRIVWSVESVATNGRNIAQFRYGQAPQGFRQSAAPDQLKVGQLYRVELWGLGGVDETDFVISQYEINRGVTVVR